MPRSLIHLLLYLMDDIVCRSSFLVDETILRCEQEVAYHPVDSGVPIKRLWSLTYFLVECQRLFQARYCWREICFGFYMNQPKRISTTIAYGIRFCCFLNPVGNPIQQK